MYELPRLAIFDLDGTLIDFEHDHFFGNAERILKQLGHGQLARAELESRFAEDDLWGFLPEAERTAFSDRFWGHYKDSVDFTPTRLLDGALASLAYFHAAGSKIAIATARSHTVTEIELELATTGALDYVSVISTRGNDKPDWRDKREQITEICRRLSIPLRSSIMVGDTPLDITSGKAAGVAQTVALLSGGIREGILRSYSPDLLVGHVGEMPPYFT